MNKKLIGLILAILVLIVAICLVLGYGEDNANQKTEITLYESIIDLENFTKEVKSNEYFKDYNNTTVDWLDDLGPNYMVLSSADGYYVMKKSDSDKIPMEFATDVSIEYICKANIVEKRPLSDDLGDVMLVSDLEYISENVTYYDV